MEDNATGNPAQSAYIKEVKALGGKIHKGIVEQLSAGDKISVFSLTKTYVGDIGVVSISKILPIYTPLITVLDLGSNGLSNACCPALCTACRELSNLRILNVADNKLITRQGGGLLFTLLSAHNELLWVGCDKTTISTYFFSRISSLSDTRMQALRENSPKDYDFWKSYINDIDKGNLPGSVVQPTPPAGNPSKANSSKMKWNRSQRPMASCTGSLSNAVNSSGSDCYADSDWSEAELKTDDPTTTPKRFIDTDVTDLFKLIDVYRPKDVSIPTPFKFPGRLSYIPVTGHPDSLLCPDDPGELPPVSDIKIDNKSMYWSFMSTARPENLKPGTRPENPNHDPKATLEKLQAEIYKANIAPPVGFVLPPMEGEGGGDDESVASVEEEKPIIKSHPDGIRVVSDKRCLPSLTSTAVGVKKAKTPQDKEVAQYFQKNVLNKNSVLLFTDSSPHANPELLSGYSLHRIIKPTFDGPTTKPSRLTSGALSANGSILATGSYDKTARLWDADNGELLSVLEGHEGYVYDVIWNAPYFDRLITASFDKTCKIWDAKTWKCLHTLGNHDLEVVCVCVNKDSTLIASGSMDQRVIVWNALTGSQVAAMNGHTAEIVCIDFGPIDFHLVSGSADETIRLWNSLTGECLSVFEGHAGEVSALKFNIHGNLILSCSTDTTCRLWDVGTKKSKILKGHSKDVSDCEFSNDGWLVASASEDMSARVWDALSAGCISMVKGHQAGICCVSFGRDSTELLTGSADMTCRRWKVSTGECLQVLSGHKSVVISSYCADEYSILTISKDNSCRIWKRNDQHSLLEFVIHFAATNPTIKSKLLGDKRIPPHLANVLFKIEERLGICAPLSSANVLHYPQPPLD